MPAINLTDNTTLNIDASSADGNATLNKYLTHPLTFLTPRGLDAIAKREVKDLDKRAFPLNASASGAGTFAVEETSLSIAAGASVSIGLLAGDDASDFFGSLHWTEDPAAAALVLFGLTGTLSAGDTAAVSDFSFGIKKAASVALTSYVIASDTDTLEDAIQRAVAALTIPHDLEDLRSLPVNCVCEVDASSSLRFTASLSYSILNNPLATASIPKLPSISINASARATIEGTATHTADHTVMIAKLANGLVHLSVSLTKTDDFETSLKVSAGVGANVGDLDALAFLLDNISPDSTAELKKIRAEMPAEAEALSGGIKAAIDASLSSSLGASLKAALEDKKSTNRLFLYEIDLAALDEPSKAALESALKGDFTRITKPGAKLAGIQELDSALTVTSTVKHTLALHLLGIFNYQSTHIFVEKSKVDYTKDTHEIVLSDETIKIVGDNLDSEKLREVVAKGISLTLPASANTPEAPAPIHMMFFDRQAGTNRSILRQFLNALEAVNAPGVPTVVPLFNQDRDDFGTCSLYLGLALTPAQCRRLFLDLAGDPRDWLFYLDAACRAEVKILAGDMDNADRLKLFNAGAAFWKDLRDGGAAPNKIRMLTNQGIRQTAVADVDALIWWSVAMEQYGKALAANQSLVDAGKDVVTDSNGGFDEPWLILAAANLLQSPPVESLFTSTLLKPAVSVAG
jgi:hypothetical protein